MAIRWKRAARVFWRRAEQEREICEAAFASLHELDRETARLRAENERLREALVYYECGSSCNMPRHADGTCVRHDICMCGKIARDALKEPRHD